MNVGFNSKNSSSSRNIVKRMTTTIGTMEMVGGIQAQSLLAGYTRAADDNRETKTKQRGSTADTF